MRINRILIPKSKAQEVNELESWKVKWRVSPSISWGSTEIMYKCFIEKHEAKEFERQLKASAEFIGVPIDTEVEIN